LDNNPGSHFITLVTVMQTCSVRLSTPCHTDARCPGTECSL